MIFTAHADGRLELADGRAVRAALGKGGVKPATEKREGDGASPIGVWPIRKVFYRSDKSEVPSTRLPLQALAPNDGWCDAPADPAYNQPVDLPYPASAESLWRTDDVYDLIVVLGYNDQPVTPGAGSAIFLHLARGAYQPTEGCVAVARDDMLAFLSQAQPGDAVAIVA